ncbi:hypothetical protein PG991_001203 [Apiospora marii]|uniref:MYND-type domain-containing protein n=1 Tax=Apiospora marii TaxID=335849 RepID=A0ABR1SU47_9PEZI
MATHQIIEEDENSPHEAYAKTNPEVLKACIMCENAGNLACAVCGTKYCSQACQKQDWKYHKMLCKSSVGTEFRLDNRPGPDYRRIIIFPVDQKKPVWDWARFEGGQRGLANKEFKRLAKCPSAKFINMGMPLNVGNLNPYMRFGRGLQLFALGEMFEGLPSISPLLAINQSILELAKPGHAQPHFGPYAVAAFSSEEVGRPIVMEGIVWEDATLKDFRLAVDSRITDENNPCIVDPHRYELKTRKPEARVWHALKLNCKGDMQRFSLKPEDDIEPVLVTSISAADELRRDCGIASSLGLSWVWEGASTNGSFIVKDNRELLKTDQDFGFHFKSVKVPENATPGNLQDALRDMRLEDHSYVGTILLMHKQGRHIQRAHLQAVVEYNDLVWARV